MDSDKLLLCRNSCGTYSRNNVLYHYINNERIEGHDPDCGKEQKLRIDRVNAKMIEQERFYQERLAKLNFERNVTYFN